MKHLEQILDTKIETILEQRFLEIGMLNQHRAEVEQYLRQIDIRLGAQQAYWINSVVTAPYTMDLNTGNISHAGQLLGDTSVGWNTT